jgi:hypothetical protein
MVVEPIKTRSAGQKLNTVLAAGVIGLLAIWSCGCQRSKPATGIQQVEDLGSGFRRVVIAKVNKGELGHYPFLLYKDAPICQLGAGAAPPSVSPSGNFAVCQDVRTGKLMLFRRRDEKVVPLTPMPFALASKFVWHEEDGTVEAEVGKEGLSGIFPLQ